MKITTSTSAVVARAETYRSPRFHRDVADALARSAADVAIVANALVDAGYMAATASSLHATARDAACLLAGVAGRQRRPESVVRVTARIVSMELQPAVGQRSDGRTHARDHGPGATFGDELANILIHSRSAAGDGGDGDFPRMSVAWSENGAMLIGTTKYGGPNAPEHLYCSVPLPAPPGAGNWDYVQISTVGGALISPASIAALARIMAAVADRAGDIAGNP